MKCLPVAASWPKTALEKGRKCNISSSGSGCKERLWLCADTLVGSKEKNTDKSAG